VEGQRSAARLPAARARRGGDAPLEHDRPRERFPTGRTRFRWSGQVYEPVDGVAFIGRSPLLAGPVFVATGDSGQGITHGVLAGLFLRDLVLGRANEWAGTPSPSRGRKAPPTSNRSRADFRDQPG